MVEASTTYVGSAPRGAGHPDRCATPPPPSLQQQTAVRRAPIAANRAPLSLFETASPRRGMRVWGGETRAARRGPPGRARTEPPVGPPVSEETSRDPVPPGSRLVNPRMGIERAGRSDSPQPSFRPVHLLRGPLARRCERGTSGARWLRGSNAWRCGRPAVQCAQEGRSGSDRVARKRPMPGG